MSTNPTPKLDPPRASSLAPAPESAGRIAVMSK